MATASPTASAEFATTLWSDVRTKESTAGPTSWIELVALLMRRPQLPHPMPEMARGPYEKARWDELKRNSPAICLTSFSGDGTRITANAGTSRVIAIDFDDVPDLEVGRLVGVFAAKGYAFVYHDTATRPLPGLRRCRFFLPLDRAVSTAEFPGVYRELVASWGISHLVDASVARTTALLFLPCSQPDGSDNPILGGGGSPVPVPFVSAAPLQAANPFAGIGEPTATDKAKTRAEATLARYLRDLRGIGDGERHGFAVDAGQTVGGYVFALDQEAAQNAVIEAMRTHWTESQNIEDHVRVFLSCARRGEAKPFEIETVVAPPKPTSLRQRAERASSGATPGRVPTGLATLDQLTGGGPRTGQLTIVAGAPGGNKTSLLAALAHRWAKDGVDVNPWRTRLAGAPREPVIVSIVACDESAGGFESRFGQLGGVSRDELDDEDDEVRAAARAKAVETFPEIYLCDPREDPGATVEAAAEALARLPGRRVLIVDSIQSRRGWACDDAQEDSPRLRIDRRLDMLMALARRLQIAVIVTSELSRAGYAKGSENAGDMATMKESGGLEYAADQVFILRRLDDDQIEVSVPKTRNGKAGSSVTLKRGAWLSFVEVEGQEEAKNNDEQPTEEQLQIVVETVRAAKTPYAGKDSLAKATGLPRQVRRSAVEVALVRQLIWDVSSGDKNSPRCYLPPENVDQVMRDALVQQAQNRVKKAKRRDPL